MLWASTISANSGFSDKNPTPGWIASAPTNWAAVIIAGIFKYDFEDGAGPIHTLSSANRTWMASLSAVEWMATVLILSSLQALKTLKATSPRFAIKILENIVNLLFNNY